MDENAESREKNAAINEKIEAMNDIFGMQLLDSIVGVIPQNVSLEQAKDDYFKVKM